MAVISSMIRYFGRIFNLFSSHSVRCQTAEKRAISLAFRPRVEKANLTADDTDNADSHG